MSFFSHINSSKTAETLHDEYWHSHIDTEQYGTFAYTSILYLNTQGEDLFSASRLAGPCILMCCIAFRRFGGTKRGLEEVLMT